jgi:hypothetical protein
VAAKERREHKEQIEKPLRSLCPFAAKAKSLSYFAELQDLCGWRVFLTFHGA